MAKFKSLDNGSCKLTALGQAYIPNYYKYQTKAHTALFDVWAMIKVLQLKKVSIEGDDFQPLHMIAPKTPRDYRKELKKYGKPTTKKEPKTKKKAGPDPNQSLANAMCSIELSENVAQFATQNSNDGTKTKKSRKGKFSEEQIDKLEELFEKEKYPDTSSLTSIGDTVNMTVSQVRSWFNNRRARFKKENGADSLAAAAKVKTTAVSTDKKTKKVKKTHQTKKKRRFNYGKLLFNSQ